MMDKLRQDSEPHPAPAFVAVDWGTSSFRSWLMTAEGAVVAESRSDEGMLHCSHTTGFEPVLREHLRRLGASERTPVLICGMAGARQGWREAPYLHTPTRLDALHTGAIRIDTAGDVRILPGLAQVDPQRPDVMRGEEVQLLGVTEPDFSGAVCIPGTHSKWVRIEQGSVTAFSTYLTGELYAITSRHSILAHAVDAAASTGDDEAFLQSARAARAHPADLTVLLFRLRAAQLLGFEQHEQGAARLSGLLIGIEIESARQWHDPHQAVRLIGTGALSRRYEAALRDAGFQVTVVDAEQASKSGLRKSAAHLWG